MKKRKMALISIILSAAIAAAGCGSSAATSSGTSSASTASEAVSDVEEVSSVAETQDTADSNQAESVESSEESETLSVVSNETVESGATSGEEISLPSTILNSTMKTGDIAVLKEPDAPEVITEEEEETIDRAMRAYVQPADSLLINDAETFYYYEQLDTDGQFLYDTMQQVAEDPGTAENYAILQTDYDPTGEEFAEILYESYMALVYDHPEYYWLYNFSKTSFGIKTLGIQTDGTYVVYFCLYQPYEDYEEEITKFNDAAEMFLADIDTTVSEAEIATQIHDKLMETVTYDYDVLDAGEAGYFDLAHTAYGALVEDSSGNANCAVCDGYALAYEYLLQQCGIDAVIMGGYGSDSDATVDETCGHAWNLINVDDKWYEADVCWDDTDWADILDGVDPSVDGYDLVKEAIEDESYVNALRHAYFGISTARIRYFSPDQSEYYTNSAGQVYSLMSDSVHVRDSEFDPASVLGTLTALAPNAA